MPDESVFSSCHSASATFVDNYTSYVLPYPGGRRVVLQNTNDYVARAACKLRSRVGLSAAFQPSDTYGFKKSETLLASLAVLELSADYWNNLTTLTQATPKATECGLELCALAYETQMTDGRPTESTVTRSTTKVPGSYDLAGDFSPEIRNFIEDDFGHDSLTEGHRAFMSGNEVSFSAVIPRYDLQVTLPQDVSLGISNPVIFNITQKSIVTMARDLYQNGTLESLTYAISNTTNVTQTFDNVARLLTYRMREADGSTASGFSEQWVVFTQVRWSLIIFPVIVLVSGYIFTIGTVLDSDRLALRTMKSDTMAALLWGLDYHARESLREEQQQYDRCSDKIAVRLTPQGTGLELRAL
ncbi:hypothetical protein SAMD00023353_0401150 [Rosellinia necatrix]|uniref:Uncharacterized protein n=1 Tax=Rosellinia necatrix TaxID=77044 RepID=A0A1S8A596_ROSNE|nr:hypothetical protein SAMD00023353_0401150 [Rosellinia necatrix]